MIGLTTPHRGTLLIVTTGLALGGAEVQLVELAVRLTHRGWRVHVATMLPPTAFVATLERAGIVIHELGMTRGVPNPRALLRLAQVVRTVRPDVVHSHMVHANLLSRLTRCIAAMPLLVCTAHSVDEGGRLRELAYRVTDPLASMTTSICAMGVARYVEVGAAPAGRIRLVPNGIDTSRFAVTAANRARTRAALGIDDDTFLWLCTGRAEAVKQHDRLLEAVASLPRDVKWTLLHAGSGPLDAELHAIRDALGLQDRVQLLGMRRDIPDLLSAADAFVMSSRIEGLSLALLEAGAAGLPSVSTDVGGCREIVLDGVSGYLVPANDALVPGLAQAMTRLMAMPTADRRALGDAGRAYVQATFEIEHVVDQWEAIYEELRDRSAARTARHGAAA